MSMNAEAWEAVGKAVAIVSNGEAKKIEGDGWKVYFIPGGTYGTVRIDIDRGGI